ncbi:hypothetical protein H6G89_30900 [Oscillatoria sp. FACHB-1407]|uniref:hypothetical protein n=1 Tax=Oscillatoria sp. FACHB-1407 TaxID=2692847 RepID=UPI0016831D9D|nr:hypothetical protein [Oscillatoria sp. FACHB-1407]MBD2465419.1 hypothetical protein [Oscillatoria sp. FACHB-1407]
MTSTANQHAVGIFPDRPTTASALQTLQDAGFPRRRMTVIARDAKQQGAIAGVPVHNHLGNRAGQGATAGALTLGLLGGAAGLAAGLGLIVIPGLASLVGLAPGLFVGEAAVGALTLTGAAVGATAGGLLGGLIGLGVPENRARQYRDRVERGDYLVLLRGTRTEIQRAEAMLHQHGIQDFGVYDVPQTLERPLEAPIPAKSIHAVHDTPATGAATLLQLDPPVTNSVSQPVVEYPPAQPIAQPVSDSPAVVPPAMPPVPPPRGESGFASNSIPPNPMPSGRPLRDPSVRSAYPEKRLMGTFVTTQLMEQALNALKNARFPMHKISVVVRDTETVLQLDDSARDTASSSGTVLSGITGLMVGLQRLVIPGQGQFLVIGGDTSALNRTQTPGKPTDLIQALTGLGISEADARLFGDRLSQGATLVMVRGVGGETLHATSILSQHGLQDWCIYDVRDGALTK